MRADATSPAVAIVLTFDADPDNFDPSLEVDAHGRFPTASLERGINLALECCARAADRLGSAPRPTWFLRADETVREAWGDPTALIERALPLWRECEQLGHELAWHPHLDVWSNGGWARAAAEQVEPILRGAHASLARIGIAPTSSRIGEGVQSTDILDILESLGIRQDSTAMPGRWRRDSERCFDWEPTPQTPYWPSRGDHRVPGTPSHDVLELPMTMTRTKADYDSEPYLRYVDLSFHSRSIREGLETVVASTEAIIAVTHPSTLAPRAEPHGLLSFDHRVFERNLDFIIERLEGQGRAWKFLTLDAYSRSHEHTTSSGERMS